MKNDISWGKIKLPKYEKVLIEDWKSTIITATNRENILSKRKIMVFSTLHIIHIQEVVNAMALGGQIGYIGRGMHIHPALPEIILRTFGNLKEP